jgi:transposase-like protein
MISFSGRHYPPFIILQCVRWYVSYALSYRNIEEMMTERGFEIDHATLNRWVLHFAPLLEKRSRKYKRPVHGSWRSLRSVCELWNIINMLKGSGPRKLHTN